jgi:UDP-N-acetylmuramate dehydrogenase
LNRFKVNVIGKKILMVNVIVEDRPIYWNMMDNERLRSEFGDRIREGVRLAKFTAARIGGPAEGLIIAESADDLAYLVEHLWDMDMGFTILGGGSNILVSDTGVRGVVILNRAIQVKFDVNTDPPSVWAESGANFGSIARQAAGRGLSGLEWAVGIPGTIGGAIVGNAGAHGAEIEDNILMAEILHQVKGIANPTVRESWEREALAFEYRSSKIKRDPGNTVVLSARLQLQNSTPDMVKKKTDEFTAYRHRTQPPGASMGSMFKNPPGDYAGKLIEAAGLKGTRIGEAEISSLHANFFINHGNARASDVRRLIDLARDKVKEKFNVELELEIELIGDWDLEDLNRE